MIGASAFAADDALGREQGGVDAACERFDQHRLLVGRVGIEAVELALVGDELRRPPAAGRAAEPGLDAGLDLAAAQVAAGEVPVVVAVTWGGAVEGQGEAACGVPEHWFEGDHRPVVEGAHDLVPGHERKRYDVVEVHGGMPLDHRQVRPADPRQARRHALPPVAREIRHVDRSCTRAARSVRRPMPRAPTPPAPIRAGPPTA